MKHSNIIAVLFLVAAFTTPASTGAEGVGSPAAPATAPAKAVARRAHTARKAATTRSGAVAATAADTTVAARAPGAARFDTSRVADVSIVPPPSHSIVEARPDYVKPVDPELEYVTEHGRREVPLFPTPLKGGKDSADDLARAILAAIAANDYKGLHLLRITNEEFDDIFWPEFPQSRPATNIRASDAWFMHVAECDDGVSELLEREAGNRLTFDHLDCTQGRMRYRNFNLYAGMVIVAHRADGTEVRLRHAWTFAERLGKWKVFMYDDKTHGEFLQHYPPTE